MILKHLKVVTKTNREVLEEFQIKLSVLVVNPEGTSGVILYSYINSSTTATEMD